jgi:hypothetical protein
MTMPVSGTIAIISAPQTCGSICASIGCASGSLATLSALTGRAAPYSMLDFYDYTNTCVSFTKYYEFCPNGSACICTCYCIVYNTPMLAGQCYCVRYNGFIDSFGSSGSVSSVRLYCNGLNILTCCVSTGGGATVSWQWPVVAGTYYTINCSIHHTILFDLYRGAGVLGACAGFAICPGLLVPITNKGIFCIGTPSATCAFTA